MQRGLNAPSFGPQFGRGQYGFGLNDSYQQRSPFGMNPMMQQMLQQFVMQMLMQFVMQMIAQQMQKGMQGGMQNPGGMQGPGGMQSPGGRNLGGMQGDSWNGGRQVEPWQQEASNNAPDQPRDVKGAPDVKGASPDQRSDFNPDTATRAPGSTRGLAQDRQRFAQELQNPAVRERLMQLTQAEVGGQSRDAALCFIESTMNRASARNKSLMATMNDPRYFPARSMRSHHVPENERASYGELMQTALAGSNNSHYATGNESGSVRSGGAPITRNFGPGRERFVVENADRRWALAMRSQDQQNTALA